MFVGEEVKVGPGVDVSVIVGVNVTVGLSVGLTVGLSVGVTVVVNVAGGVVEGEIVGVDVGGAGGMISVDMSASRINTPMRMGMPYFLRVGGRADFFGSTGG